MFLGCLVITASHNPYNWLGLKIKSFKGCSVDESFTKEVEKGYFWETQLKDWKVHMKKLILRSFI
jgi:phosphomannomutase